MIISECIKIEKSCIVLCYIETNPLHTITWNLIAMRLEVFFSNASMFNNRISLSKYYLCPIWGTMGGSMSKRTRKKDECLPPFSPLNRPGTPNETAAGSMRKKFPLFDLIFRIPLSLSLTRHSLLPISLNLSASFFSDP